MTENQWTTEPPTKEGWYWRFDISSKKGEREAVKVFFDINNDLLVNCCGKITHISELSSIRNKFFYWTPIAVPPLPEGKENVLKYKE